MKTQIITKLDILLSMTDEANIHQITLINSIKKDLINEWNASDDYAQQIREVLDMDNTYELLNNIKIR
jgi:phosphoglucomutase